MSYKDIFNYIENILKFIIVFIIMVTLLLSLQIVATKIPKEKIKENMLESAEFYKKKSGIHQLKQRREYSYVHYYADSVLLNIIYCLDSNNPLESVMMANQYKKIYADVNTDFIKTVEEDVEPTIQYLRYWHGPIAILRPLLVYLNVEQIYLVNKIFLFELAIALLIILFIKNKKLAFIYLISMILTVFSVVPECFEYSWTFYVMFITSIIAVLIEKKGNKGLFYLFFISGILTCFLDFLSTEIITFFVPILFVFALRYSDGRLTNFKEEFKFFFKSAILWGCAYVGMWFTKWVLASIILKINAFDYVKENAMLRINGLQGLRSKKILYTGALYRNFHILYPINLVKKNVDLIKYASIFLVILVSLFDWKNIKKKWFSLIMIIIGLMPYTRYLVLANHAYRHAFFTFRDQMITIIALGLIIIDCFNYKLWFKKIKIINRGAKNGQRIDDTNSSSK